MTPTRAANLSNLDLLEMWNRTNPRSAASRQIEATLAERGLVPTFGRAGTPVLVTHPSLLD